MYFVWFQTRYTEVSILTFSLLMVRISMLFGSSWRSNIRQETKVLRNNDTIATIIITYEENNALCDSIA